MNARLVILAAGTAGLALAGPVPASAEDGIWKAGSTYVVRFEHLDLTKPADRQALLVQVERAARKLCQGLRTDQRRAACEEAAIGSALKASPAEVRLAVQTARLERDGKQQARR